MHFGLPEANSCSSGWPPGVWILANTLILYIFVMSKSDINVELYTYRYLLVFYWLMSAPHDHSQQDLDSSIFICLWAVVNYSCPCSNICFISSFSFGYFSNSPWFASLGLTLLLFTEIKKKKKMLIFFILSYYPLYRGPFLGAQDLVF